MYLFIKEPVCDTVDSGQTTTDNRLTHFKTVSSIYIWSENLVAESEANSCIVGYKARGYCMHVFLV